MPRPQTLAFAVKLVSIAEDAQNLLTPEEVAEAFLNVTQILQEQVEPKVAAEALAAVISKAIKRNPNLVN